MAIDWNDYKSLSRADKASRMNQFDREMESTAKAASKGDIDAESAVTMTAWVVLMRALELSAAEIAEAILLCETPFPYADFDGRGPYGGGDRDQVGNDIIDRAMCMASGWKEDGYPDCFCMHNIGYTKFGSMDRLHAVANAGRLPQTFVAELEAGALAAKAACDVLNFMVMTEPHNGPAATTAQAVIA